MESELNIFFKLWLWVITALCYSYHIPPKFPNPALRLLALLPVFYLLITLPLNLSSFHLTGPTAFFLVWLATFKLLLFCFRQGPLSSPPPPSFLLFVSSACLPIQLHQQHEPSPQSRPGSVLFTLKTCMLAISFRILEWRQHMQRHVLLAFYCVHMYLELELVLALCAIPVRAFSGYELEPQFNEPYLATSLQDFWGRRWNLMVTKILRPTVYDPVKRLCGRMIGPLWASFPAIVAAFVVSGLMHEIIYFYITRAPPTWEVTWFFVLHGICVALEVAVKRAARGRWELHRGVSGPLTVAFLAVTGGWLFFPQLTRNGVNEKALREYALLCKFLKERVVCLF